MIVTKETAQPLQYANVYVLSHHFVDGVRAGNEMGNTYVIKEGIELLILSSPIYLHRNDFPIQEEL
jgi:hypothetical protein